MVYDFFVELCFVRIHVRDEPGSRLSRVCKYTVCFHISRYCASLVLLPLSFPHSEFGGKTDNQKPQLDGTFTKQIHQLNTNYMLGNSAVLHDTNDDIVVSLALRETVGVKSLNLSACLESITQRWDGGAKKIRHRVVGHM